MMQAASSQSHQNGAVSGPEQQQQQQQNHVSSLQSKQEPDSDDGNNVLQSGDENDQDDDHDSTGAVRNGKRKRPISVSRNSVFCEYRERKKPGLRAGYGRELEQRLDKLEEILRSHSEILQSSFINHTHLNVAPSVRNSNPSLPSDQGTPREPISLFRPTESIRTPQAETALFLQKPSTFHTTSQHVDFGLPPPTPSIHSVHDGFQSQMSMAGISPPNQLGPSLQPGPTAQEYYGQSQQPSVRSPGVSVTQGQTQISSDQDLPPYDLLYALVDLYFKHINTWCPILHRKSTLDSLFGPSTLDDTDKVLLHAIVAATLRYSTDARLTEEKRRHYHDVSKQRVLLYGMENSSVKALQALVILALDLCGSSNGPPGWNIMALITRSVVQLGLAVETNSLSVSPSYASIYTLRAMILPEPKDFIEEESRRRLFWMIYLLDRYATIATAFDFALGDKEIDRTLPCRDDLWIKNQKVETRWFRTQDRTQDRPPDLPDHEQNKPENLGAFSYYIEILGILSKIHEFLKQPVDIGALGDVEQWQLRYKELDNLLASWKFGLPGEYGNMAKLFQPGGSKTLNCAWVMLHATYHTAVIRLHSSAAYPTTRSPIFTPSYGASQRCLGAVENIAALGEFVVQNGMLNKLGPPFAFTLWVAARLLLVHGSTVEHKLAPQIAFLVDTLRDMGRYWPVAGRYCQLLQRVLDEHSDSERAVGQTGERITPSSVKILADMRRTAFDLDFLISRQPRHLAGAPSRRPSVTPARTPAPNELEYLDVFDFFNVPRLPFSHEASSGPQNSIEMSSDSAPNNEGGGMSNSNGASNEFNITNFMVDANSDWLYKQPN
ncbi:putative C6 transcription factor [Daldinia caldariorum]|uniref:putative C6 transcription factor n=1 Tax=Daldinia caldariorum TaxID=326644 RepID=UPI002008C3E8|nr:putative C6 transcription factor [Daldinia caldariorum]KAI1467765.1 putative C6 transcription factor [Daldinia caldariorum]